MLTVGRSLGIWIFLKNVDAAKEFIKFYLSRENYSDLIKASEYFNVQVYNGMEDHPAWKVDPKYESIKKSGKYGHLYGWPAAGNERSQQVTCAFVIPSIFAKAVTGGSAKEAIAWAEEEIRRIYGN